ncbi:hypothetical protein [Estrella lausannensis]|uniref:2OGFeDO JBP1/TET oxygenase domain-containing protein n=1 Tax=Estrella lausannensis TaxID=483423 RepID=A0A0H5DN15_9BACT|nr:hypothetical protein [Estrella lausannensis]CRX37596.1 hypothetical protein ELAC_0235 [Estrella lausannensis]
MNIDGTSNISTDITSSMKTSIPPETSIVDELQRKVSNFLPKPPKITSERQFGLQVLGHKGASPLVAPAAAANSLCVDQNQNIQVVSDAALVKNSMVEKRVSKNNHDWKLAEHVDDETIAKFTPKENIADGEDTVFLDQDGNFICSIAYDAINVADDAIDTLAKVPQSTRERGAAAGVVDREAMDKFYQDLNERRKSSTMAKVRGKSNQRVEYSEEFPWLAHLNGDKKAKRGNAHYSTSFGCARNFKTPAQVEADKGEKKPRYEKVRPYFKLISDCFEKKWSDQYRSYTQIMKKNGGDNFYLADSVFSTIVVNTHEIASNGKVLKDARAAIHTDSGHHDESFEVMLCLKKNVEGGDLYLPEYGILLKLRHKCVVCFRAKLHKHAVTEIRRKELDSTALRVTLVAYMTKFSNSTLKQVVESKAKSHEPVSQLPSPRFKPSDFEEGGEEESEPSDSSQVLKKTALKNDGSGISTPSDQKDQAFPNSFEGVMNNTVAAPAAPFAGIAPPSQGLFYPQLSGASVNPIPWAFPNQAAYCFGPTVPVIPAYQGILQAQQIYLLQKQLEESHQKLERLEQENSAMRAYHAQSQEGQQLHFRSEESREEMSSPATLPVWHTETTTSSVGKEDRGIKRPSSELDSGQYLNPIPLEKQTRPRRH